MINNKLDHKHIFVESTESYTLICGCGVEISVTSQPDISLQEDEPSIHDNLLLDVLE